jgi:hypothetical protein
MDQTISSICLLSLLLLPSLPPFLPYCFSARSSRDPQDLLPLRVSARGSGVVQRLLFAGKEESLCLSFRVHG